ncbi:MAG TPA: hypothetical protein VHT73_11960 [Thermodesulfobacteriota bacterium]|nr:hypothetical protein [Thermodesulfobacteriota bacterium]
MSDLERKRWKFEEEMREIDSGRTVVNHLLRHYVESFSTYYSIDADGKWKKVAGFGRYAHGHGSWLMEYPTDRRYLSMRVAEDLSLLPLRYGEYEEITDIILTNHMQAVTDLGLEYDPNINLPEYVKRHRALAEERGFQPSS